MASHERHCAECNWLRIAKTIVPWKLHTEIDKRFFIKTSENSKHSLQNESLQTNNKNGKEIYQMRFKNARPCISTLWNTANKRSSKKERRVDALALRAEERRDKLRKAAGRSKYPLSRRYLNGETRLDELQSSIRQSITYGREPGELKHLSSRRKRKKKSISKVAASEMERGQTMVRAPWGSDRIIDSLILAERFWESLPERVKAP